MEENEPPKKEVSRLCIACGRPTRTVNETTFHCQRCGVIEFVPFPDVRANPYAIPLLTR